MELNYTLFKNQEEDYRPSKSQKTKGTSHVGEINVPDQA